MLKTVEKNELDIFHLLQICDSKLEKLVQGSFSLTRIIWGLMKTEKDVLFVKRSTEKLLFS